jgi:hypothetical protein
MDAASGSVQKGSGEGKGDPEKVGLADQVRSASGGAHGDQGKTGSKKSESVETNPAEIFNALKKMTQLRTLWEVEREEGGGVGSAGTGAMPDSTTHVGNGRGTGQEKGFHTSAVTHTPPTFGQAPEAPKKPKEKTTLEDQHEHITHRKGGASENGKGDVVEEPVLPSQRKVRKEEGEDEPKRFRSGARG